jgi:uncharacterized membrane protein YwzB
VAEIIGRLLNVALGFVGIVLLVLFIAGGFLWMTAGGDTEKVKKARAMLVNAVAGLVIIGLSYAVTSFVLEQLESSILGGGGEAATSTESGS